MKFTQCFRIETPSSTNALTMSRDGSQVAATSFDQKLRAYKTDDMSLLKSAHLGTSFPNAVCYSPDGRLVGSGGKSLTLFDTLTWKKGGTLKGHRHEIQDAVFSPDGGRVYTGSGNGYTPSDWTVRAWESATGEPLWKWKAAREVYALAASPDGRFVAAGDSNGEVTLLEAATGTARWTSQLPAWVYCLRFTRDGATLVASGDFEHLAVIAVADGASREVSIGSFARSFALSPDDSTAVVGGTRYGEATPLVAVDLASGHVRSVGPAVGRLPQGVEWSPDGARLYVLVNDPHELLVFELSR